MSKQITSVLDPHMEKQIVKNSVALKRFFGCGDSYKCQDLAGKTGICLAKVSFHGISNNFVNNIFSIE